MKLPFYTVLGPLFRKNHKPIRELCAYRLFCFSPFYVMVLGVLGVILSIFDIIRIVKSGPVLQGCLCRSRLKTGKVITPEAERDCKLICLVLSTEYYLFLLIGLSTNSYTCLLPFLVVYAIIIYLEFLTYLLQVLTLGILDFKKTQLLMSLFMVYNWSSVFCTFKNPIFFLPFLILYAAIISLESVIFFTKAFIDGVDYKKSTLLMSMFMVYNWLSVFCTFARVMTGCDV